MPDRTGTVSTLAECIGSRIPIALGEVQPSREQLAEVVAVIARKFRPQRIVLFGSRAWGGSTWESDIDLLVVMPTPMRPVDQAVIIRERLELRPSFPLDMLVRTPEQVAQGLAEGDFFIEDVLLDGISLDEADDSGLG